MTSGNKGIGKALCAQLLEKYNDTYVILAARDETRGQEAVASIVQRVGADASSRIEFLPINVTDEESIRNAADAISAKYGFASLYAIVNNAAIGFGLALEDTLKTNVYGPHHVTTAFLPLLVRTADPSSTGRIVNISSASGPNYVAKLDTAGIPSTLFTDPSTTWEQLSHHMEQVLQTAAENPEAAEKDAYGLSKACLNAYTVETSLLHPDLLVNSCTPGFIDTDLTKGFGAKLTPDQGTVSVLHCLFSPDVGTGKYFGSDGVRSPLHKYRGPGEPPYEP